MIATTGTLFPDVFGDSARCGLFELGSARADDKNRSDLK